MKLVSESEYEKFINFKHKGIPNTLRQQHFEDNEQKGAALLSLESIPDDIKVALYNSLVRDTFQKISELKSNEQGVKQVSELSEKELSASDKFLVQFLPSVYQPAAERIIKYLKTASGLISWDHTGRCSFYGTVEPYSNIVDLLSYVLKSNAKSREPVGTSRFLYMLKLLNVPTSILGLRLRTKLSKETLGELKKKQRKSGVFTPQVQNQVLEEPTEPVNEPSPSTSKEVHFETPKAAPRDIPVTSSQEEESGPTWLEYIPWRGNKRKLDQTTLPII
jgi:hypothetical protein